MSIYQVMIIVACVALAIVRLLPPRWIALLLPPSGEGPSIGDECVACSSRNVRVLGPMVYRCNACGHEGGDGWATYERARRDATFEAWSPAKRRKSARRDLMEARTLILAGLGDLERAGSYAGSEHSSHTSSIRWSLRPMGPSVGLRIDDLRETEHWEHEQATASALGRLLEAKAKARDAQAKLGTSLGDPVDASFDESAGCMGLLAEGTALLGAVEAELRSLRRGARARARASRRAPPP